MCKVLALPGAPVSIVVSPRAAGANHKCFHRRTGGGCEDVVLEEMDAR